MPEEEPNHFPSPEENMIEASKQFEDAWRKLTRANQYPKFEVEDAVDFLSSQLKNYKYLLDTNDPEIDPRTLNLVFMGLYHYNIAK